MMIDNTENNEFRELLSDYAKPVDDDGFCEQVLMQAPNLQASTPQNTDFIKRLMVGGAAVLATFIAVPQVGKLQQMIGGIKLPEISIPANYFNTTHTPNMTIIALLAALLVGLASAFLFSSDM